MLKSFHSKRAGNTRVLLRSLAHSKDFIQSEITLNLGSRCWALQPGLSHWEPHPSVSGNLSLIGFPLTNRALRMKWLHCNSLCCACKEDDTGSQGRRTPSVMGLCKGGLQFKFKKTPWFNRALRSQTTSASRMMYPERRSKNEKQHIQIRQRTLTWV